VNARSTTKEHHQASGTMKTNELSKQVRDKGVENYRSLGLGNWSELKE
jgi:hypothetical protein